MRSIIVIPCLLLAIVIATLLHKSKSDLQTDDIDKIGILLKGIETTIPESTHISYHAEGVGTDVYLWCRYLLAPRYISLVTGEKLDTVLTICNKEVNDSITERIIRNRKIVSENKDNRFFYILTCSR